MGKKKTKKNNVVKEEIQEEINVVEETKEEVKKEIRYFSYAARLTSSIIILLVSLSLGIFLLIKSFGFVEQETISYNENSNLDYKVYLKENDFYEEDYLGKDMLYVANLIDKVKVDFEYIFKTDKNVNLDFNYNIIGKLVIADKSGKNSYYEKEYVLLKNKELSLNDDNRAIINEEIDIDYGYYNGIANRFKNAYGVDTLSKLTLSLNISKRNNSDNGNVIVNNNKSQMIINIPLSEKAVDIEMNYKEIDSSSDLISKSDVVVENIVCMIVSIILIIVSLVMAVKTIRLLMLLRTKQSEYDKYLKKILNEYDRLIVETTTCPVITGDNVIEINRFNELVDVRDNLKLPIMYYSVAKHHKSYFYITYESKIYLYVLKSSDLEKNQ